MKTTIHCDERITNIRHTIYVKLFWGIIIANELTYLLTRCLSSSCTPSNPFFHRQVTHALAALCSRIMFRRIRE